MAIAAKLGAIAAFWLAIGLVQTFNWGHGVAKAVVMALLLIATPFIMAGTRAGSAPLPPRLHRMIAIALGVLLVGNIVFLGLRIAHPRLIDIATTTLAAGEALLHGANPYTLPIDAGPEAAGFTGYKYLPVMIAAYLPLGAILGARGILLTNLVILLACLWLMRRLAGTALAPLLLLMLPMVSAQLFAKGATDLVAVLPLLAAAAVAERSGFLAGLGVGLSIAAKLVPGALFLPCLLPALGRWRYIAGVAVGLTPLLPFLVLSPHALIANTLLFNLQRVPDATSWMLDAPAAAIGAAHLAMAAVYLAAFVYVWRQAPPLVARFGIAAMLTLAAILSGPAAHHNYQLWWLPFYCVLLSAALAPSETCQETGFRYTSALGIDTRGS
jgi:hypothetical protein